MPKLPRQISGERLVNLLKQYDYEKVRKKGSHIRLTSNYNTEEHHITIPDHAEIKLKTLNNILNDIAGYLEITKDELVRNLF
jgi:predicted RNA binding protein YcfA (HicA-like mRNA interferase family)